MLLHVRDDPVAEPAPVNQFSLLGFDNDLDKCFRAILAALYFVQG